MSMSTLLVLISVSFCLNQCFAGVLQLSDDQKQEFVDAHNNWRAKAGASAMMKITWNDDIAKLAAEFAGRCAFRYSSDDERSNIGGFQHLGENIYYFPKRPSPTEIVDGWGAEGKDYDLGSNSCKGVCGHYTQVVWADTTSIGCAIAQCETLTDLPNPAPGYMVYCDYGPAGVWNGRRPFEAGPAGSKCQEKYGLAADESGLCGGSQAHGPGLARAAPGPASGQRRPPIPTRPPGLAPAPGQDSLQSSGGSPKTRAFDGIKWGQRLYKYYQAKFVVYAADCKALCQADKNCYAMTYDGGNTMPNGNCFLMGRDYDSRSDPTYTWAAWIKPSTPVPAKPPGGSTSGNTPSGGSTDSFAPDGIVWGKRLTKYYAAKFVDYATHCKALCQQDKNCRAMTYDGGHANPIGNCFLLASGYETRNDPTYTWAAWIKP